MKSKNWLISLGLAVILVVAFALPACEPTEESGWYTSDGQRLSFELTTPNYSPLNSMGIMIAQDLQDVGLDVSPQEMEPTTFIGRLYYPHETPSLEMFIYGEAPSLPPWSDWIWVLMMDPEGWGAEWNPFWYQDDRYDELGMGIYYAANLTERHDMLYELQEILAEDLPAIFLVNPSHIAAYRTDEWTGWTMMLDGPVSWINPHSIMEVEAVGEADTLNIGFQAMMPSTVMLRETIAYTNWGCLYLWLVYDQLAGMHKAPIGEEEQAYEWVYRLAENITITWEDEGDGWDGPTQVWTVDLREGMKWHDYDTSGKNLTADDVLFTFLYVHTPWWTTKPLNWTAVEANDYEVLPEHWHMEKVNDYQIRFWYPEEEAISEAYAPDWVMWDNIVPKHIFEEHVDNIEEFPNTESVGTGPYKMHEFEEDSHMHLKINQDYWGDKPNAENVIFRLYTTGELMFGALKSGEIDATGDESLPWQRIAEFEAVAGMEVEVVGGDSVWYLGFNLYPEGLLQDKALRQSIAHAIDKEALLEMLFGDYGTTSDSWMYTGIPDHNPDLPQYELSAAMFKSVVEGAGYYYVE